jgi:hypothetical protein
MSFQLAHGKFSPITHALSSRVVGLFLSGVIASFGLAWWNFHCIPLCNQAREERRVSQNLSFQQNILAEKIKKSSLYLSEQRHLAHELATFVAPGSTLQGSLNTLVESMQKVGLVCVDIKPVFEKIKIKKNYKSAVVDVCARGSFKKVHAFLSLVPTLHICLFKKIALHKDERKRLCLNAQLKIFLSNEAAA